MGETAYVSQLPTCDIHQYVKHVQGVEAAYDGKTLEGSWANMCEECFSEHGVGLGTGKGQRLILGERPTSTRCPCDCNSGGFCGGCGHAGCGRR